MDLKEIADQLNKNIEEGREIGELTAGLLLKNLPASLKQIDFLHSFFTVTKIILNDVTPVVKKDKVSVQFLNRHILNATDVTIEITFESVSGEIVSALKILSEQKIELLSFLDSLKEISKGSEIPSLPGGLDYLGKFGLSLLAISLNTKSLLITSAQLTVYASEWKLPGMEELFTLKSVFLDLTVLNPMQTQERKIKGDVKANLEAPNVKAIEFSADLTNFVLEAQEKTINLANIAEYFGAALPDTLPRAEADLDFTIKPRSNEYHFNAEMITDWKFGSGGLKSKITFGLDHKKKPTNGSNDEYITTASITAVKNEKTPPLSLMEGLKIKDFSYQFNTTVNDKQSDWKFKGTTNIGILDGDFELDTEISKDETARMVHLSSTMQSESVIVKLPEVGGELKKFDFDFTVTNKDEADKVKGKIETILSIPPIKELSLRASLNSKIAFFVEVKTDEIKLSDFLKKLNIPEPNDLPQIEAEGSYQLSYLPLTKINKNTSNATLLGNEGKQVSELALKGDTTIKWQIDQTEVGAETNFNFYRRLERENGSGKKLTQVDLQVTRAAGTGEIAINDDIKIKDFNFGFHLNKSQELQDTVAANDTDWIVGGQMNVDLLNNEFQLDAGVSEGKVVLHSETKEIDIADIGKLGAKFQAALVKQKGDALENIKGDAKWVQSKDAPKFIGDTVLELNGENAFIDGGAFIAPGNQFTVEAWICPKNFNNKPALASFAESENIIFYAGSDNSAKPFYWDSVNEGKICSKELEKGKWSHIAFVLSNKENIKFYLNGDETNSENLQEAFPAITPHLRIGASGKEKEFYNGQIADLRIWDRIRSADEIKNNKDKRLTGDEPGLAAYYPLDEKEGKVAKDKTQNSFFSGKLEGTLSITKASTEFNFYAGIRKNFYLQAKGENINLSGLADVLNIDLPEAMPEITADLALNLLRRADIQKWDISLSAAAKTKWQLQDQEAPLFTSEVGFNLNRKADKDKTFTTGSFRFFATNSVQLIEEIKFNKFDFTLTKTTEKWSVDSASQIEVLDKAFDFSADYEYGKAQSLKLTMTNPSSPVEIEFLQFKVSSFSIEVSKKNKTTNWTVSSETALKIDPGKHWESPLIDFEGTTKLYKDKQVWGLGFYPTHADIEFPIIEGPAETRFDLSFDPIRFSYNAETKKWDLKAGVTAKLTQIPEPIRKAFPQPLDDLLTNGIHPTFEATQDSISIGIEKFFNPLVLPAQFDLVDSHGSIVNKIDLGQFALDVSNFKITLSKALNFSADFKIALPSKLNNIFGTDSQGIPCLEIFNTYNEGEPEKSVYTGFEVAVGVLKTGKPGIGLKMVTSPIKAMPVDEGGNWHVTLGKKGEYGAFEIELPQMSYGGAAFSGSGGYKIVKEINIPFEPLKQLCIQFGFPEIAAKLPHKVPVKQLNLIDKKGGSTDPKDWTLNIDGIKNVLKVFFTEAELKPILDALETIKDQFDHLPSELVKYLDMQWPSGLTFTLTITADGGVSFNVATEGEGIRLLYPSFNPMPGLQGITLRSVSFGEILGGSLFLLKWDGDFDYFDLPSLAASVLIPDMEKVLKKFHLPKPADFHRKVIITNLYTIIIYETEIPIPIPLFYKELGIDVLGVEGVNIQTHAHFGWDKPVLGELAKAGLDLYKFCSDPKYHLPVKNPPQVCPIFRMNDWFIALPEYLGGQLIGKKGDLVKIDPNKLLAYLLNGIKFFSLDDFINLIPVDYRVNDVGAHVPINNFICVDMEAAWLISTPEEFFDQQVYKRIVKTKEDADKLFAVLPEKPDDKPVAADEKGLIVFLKGRWDAQLAGFDVAFGLIAIDSKKFMTGVEIKGYIIDLLNVYIKATVLIDPPKTPFQLTGKGKTHFSILGLNIVDAQTSVYADNTKFQIDGAFYILPKDFPVNIKSTMDGIGGTISKDRVDIHGGIEAKFFFISLSGNVYIANDGMSLKLESAGRTLGFSVDKYSYLNKDWVRIHGKLPVFMDDYESTTLIDPASGSFKQNLVGRYLQLVLVGLGFDLDINKTYTDVTGHGTVYSIITKHNMMDGAVSVSDKSFCIKGSFYLFPENFLVNVNGTDNTIVIDSSGINVKGHLSANFGPIQFAKAKIEITKKGFKLSGNVLGHSVDALIENNKGPNFIIGFDLNFGPLKMHITIKINKLNGETNIYLHSDLAGLVLDAKFRDPSVKGSYTLSIYGMTLLSGAIKLTGSGFSLSGSIDFVVATLNISGQIDKNGINLKGSCKFGLPSPFPSITVTMIIHNGPPVISIEALGCSGKGGVAVYKKELSILIYLKIGLKCASKKIYIVIPFGKAPIFYWHKPKNWPLGHVKIDHLTANDIPVAAIEAEEPEKETLEMIAYNLKDTKIFVEFIKRNMMSKGRDIYTCMRPLRDEGFLEKAYYTADKYQIELDIDYKTDEPYFSCVRAFKTEEEQDFFTQLKYFVLKEIENMDPGNEEIKQYGPDNILDVNCASAVFTEFDEENGNPKAKFTLNAARFEKPVEITVDIEFKNIEAAFKLIAEKLI